MNLRNLFLKHVAQTSSAPLALDIVRAQGAELFDRNGKAYIDLIAGISVCNVGHCHPEVVAAIQKQAAEYLHIMVYGEFIQSPQVLYAQKLTQHLPSVLNAVYFTNSGAEATEGAMKLAKRVTGRTRIISFEESYHGSTQGALSVMGSEYWRNAFRPLLPDVYRFRYNDWSVLDALNEEVACVIVETVQAESGVTVPSIAWLQALRQKCTENGILLIMDEIQAGFGRTGTLWAFEQFGVVPDVLLLGKALGGGMPLGAFVAAEKLMWSLTEDPVLGHITTFGGHPVSCAAGLAAMEVLLKSGWMGEVEHKAQLFKEGMPQEKVVSLRQHGLWMALEFDSFASNKKVIDYCIQHGVITDWFLFNANCLRIGPPLCISTHQIELASAVIQKAVKTVL